VRRPLPAVADRGWIRTPIDAFVRARLEAEGLAPAPEADRTTLLRRAHLDLVGLPPSVAEVDAFLADTSPRAFEAVVDRLLASPHFGERWARWWLDAARYADSDGFEKDKSRVMWFYRDWVIGALNRDLPYDRFVIEQIAGDLLPGATQDQVVATGFLRNSMINEEGGVDPEQFRMDALFDRMDALGKAVLGLTIQCAQCHTHKYDPVTQEEYYRLLAFLNADDEAVRAVYTPAEETIRLDILARIGRLERDLQRGRPLGPRARPFDWRAMMAAWEAGLARPGPSWTVLRGTFDDDSTAGQKFLPQEDGSYRAAGYAPAKSNPFVVLKAALPEIGALRLELLLDPNLPRGGPGRSYKGTCALSEIVVEAAPADAPEKKTRVAIAAATADFEQDEQPLEAQFADKTAKRRTVGPARFAIDGRDETAWGIDAGPGLRNAERHAVFVFAEPIRNAAGTLLTVTLRQQHGGWNNNDHQNNNLGRLRISVTPSRDVAAEPVPARVRALVRIPPAARTAAQAAEIFSAFRATVPAWKAKNDEIARLWARHPEGTTALVLAARPGGRATRLLRRGDFLKPAHAVEPGVPAALHPLPAGAPPTRLGLARWLVDRRSPTTARVVANRVWQAYFGAGLVATPEDLGTQGEAPSHPELLDWLAVELMDRGFRLKELHRLIVLSATYRQASRLGPELLARDPSNRLLARGPRFRVDGEVVRDIFFASSGLLDRRVGGPAVMPPAPAFLFEPPSSYGHFPWVTATGPEAFRRALYVFRRRSTPYPMLQAFDVPNGETACARRARSNTPLQALVTLNEPLSMEAARALGRRMLEVDADGDRERLAHGFRRVLARAPSPAELDDLLGLLARQRTRAGGEAPGAAPADLAAYTVVARVILNLDETITKE
jgi:hypothetical protein